ncbi:MAG: TonB-dependent receptor plug domain-containing protein [Opitutaceae bacterium]|nr:TonB-dependent receptor plug domain-containing protein [Opitutaceae bacterium]
MTTPRQFLPNVALAASLLVFTCGRFASAQSAASSPTPQQLAKYDRNHDGKLDASELAALQADEARAASSAAAKDDALTLTPFEVSADPNDTYDATNTNSVTGTNTPLSKTPLDAKIFNRQLMDEMNVTDMTEMLWKFGGLGPAVINAGEDVRGMLEGDRQDPKSMMMRGLQINNPRRDGFLRSDTTLLDSFDIERVEAIGGSNSLLFGSGDAGGVITSASKRAYLNRRPTMTVSATGDSEGSRRYTLDAQAGNRMFAVRANGVKGAVRNFRPGLRQQSEGYQFSATFQPWKRLQIRGEYRYYTRDTVFAQAVIVRAPLAWLLPTGQRVDNQNSRYLVAFPEAVELLGGVFDITKVDSAIAPMHRDAYFNHIKSVVAEATLTEGLAVQLRYGHDARINDALRASNTTVYAPGATGNNYIDPATGRAGTAWAMNQSQVATPFWTGARGYRASIAYQKNLGRWGRHQASAFRQDMDSWTNQQPWRFYETDAGGEIIQNLANITNAESGRIVMPAVWMAPFPTSIIGGRDWRVDTITHPNGKTYKYTPQIYTGAVPKTERNPMGLSGPTAAVDNAAGTVLAGQSTVTGYFLDDTRETSHGVSLFSEWWKGHIDTMAGYRAEEASAYRVNTDLRRGPITYDSLTAGAVIDTPIKGLRVSVNYATNAKINFDTTRDIFNQPLPAGRGESKDVGLKFGLWEHRVSGNLNYYVSEAQNFTASLGGLRNDIDPAGINGRNGGNAYTYSKTSDGFNLTLSTRPVKGWEMRINFATANGSERTDVTLPQFYNDQFNTTTVNGQQVVGVKESAGAAVSPLLVPSDPLDPASGSIPLSLAMMRDPSSPYYALLDRESGYILNAESLGLLTPGVGTNVTGLPITEHQLGFVSPSDGSIIVRRSGERTVGYAERSYSMINRYQFASGRLRGVVVGLSTSFHENYRTYMYTDAADGGKRKTFYFPNRFLNDMFVVYSFSPVKRVRASVQVNVSNLFNANQVVYLPRGTDGTLRYAQWFNTPRKLAVTTRLSY